MPNEGRQKAIFSNEKPHICALKEFTEETTLFIPPNLRDKKNMWYVICKNKKQYYYNEKKYTCNFKVIIYYILLTDSDL